MKHLITICFCLVFTLSLYGQKQLALKEKIKITSTTRKIVNTLVDNSTGEFIRVFEQTLGTKKIEKGSFAGVDFIEKQQGLIGSNGKEIILSANEQIVSAASDQLLTFKPNYNENTTQLISYQLSNNNMTRQGEMKTYSVEVSPVLMDNGSILISDESEGFGSQVKIYSKDFKLLNTYIPFTSGFKSGLFAYNNRQIISGFENDAGETRIAIFSAFTGKLLNEGILNQKVGLQILRSFSAYILMYGLNKLTCTDLQGNLLWNFNLNLKHLEIFNDGANEIYVSADSEFLGIDVRTGKINWRKNLIDLHSMKVQNSSSQSIQIISLESVDDAINIIFSVGKKGAITQQDIKLENKLVVLDKKGDVIQRIPLSQNAKLLSMRKTPKGLQIIQDQEILRYEK